MRSLAIDIGGTAVKSCIVKTDGTIADCRKEEYKYPITRDCVLKSIFDAADSYVGFEGIGVSTTAHVEPDGSIGYASANIPGYAGTQLRKLLEERYHTKVSVIRDSTAMAWGEIAFGAGKEFKDFVCVTYGSGVGGALIIDGKPYLGAGWGAGQFGHIMTHFNGNACQCGLTGCYEAYASANALSGRAEQELGIRYSGIEIFERLARGEKEFQCLVDEWAFEAAIGLSSIVHTLSPACIVLGGGVMEQDYVIAYIQKKLLELTINACHHFEIRKAVHGNSTNLLGAAYALWKFHGRER